MKYVSIASIASKYYMTQYFIATMAWNSHICHNTPSVIHTRNFSSHAVSVLHAAVTLLHIAEGVLLREVRYCRRWRAVVSQLRVLLTMLCLACTVSWWNFQIILVFAMLHHPYGLMVYHPQECGKFGVVDLMALLTSRKPTESETPIKKAGTSEKDMCFFFQTQFFKFPEFSFVHFPMKSCLSLEILSGCVCSLSKS